jgi:hypothetical protein
MKYEINENQIKKLVFDYIDHYIEPYNLIKNTKFEDQITWGTPNGTIIISYFPYEKEYIIPSKMNEAINSFFPQTLPLFNYKTEWLEERFGYECNWLAYDDDDNEDEY